MLTGAGASLGSLYVFPYPPPLGTRLFDELAREFPHSWGAIPADLMELFRMDFEEGMSKIWERYSQNVAPLMQQMAIYFSKFRPSSELNLYTKLISKVYKNEVKDILFSTLNYDCVMELAASTLSLPVNYFGAPDTASFPLWKLHGSCNFKLEGIEAQGVTYTAGVAFGGSGIKSIQPEQVPFVFGGGTSLYPVMSIYARGKPTQMAPGLLESVQQKWADHILHSDLIEIIGVNPHPVDKHVWGPLARTKARIAFVGDKERFEKWVNETRPTEENIWLSNQFKDGFDSLVSETI